jgi:uncharacterized protein (DUF1015 family)
MTRIHPFRGWRYDVATAGARSLDDLVAPPYDVIDSSQQAALHQRHPDNIVRAILGQDRPGDDDRENRYVRAARFMAQRRASGVLRQEAAPAIYYLREDFTLPGGQGAVRNGMIFRLRLASWGDGILPHERTFPAAKADRLALTIATGCQFSPIFLLYSDPAGEVLTALQAAVRREPDAAARDEDGSDHALWAITDPASWQAAAAQLESRTFYVADGHHRYETALNYQRFRRGVLPKAAPPAPLTTWESLPNFAQHPEPGPDQMQAFDTTWAYAARLEDPGVTILPTHRCVHGLEDFDAHGLLAGLGGHFDVVQVAGDDELLAALQATPPGVTAFGLVLAGRQPGCLLRLRLGPAVTELLQRADHPTVAGVDAAILQTLVLGPLLGIERDAVVQKHFLAYTPDARQAMAATRSGHYQAAFLMKPTSLEQLTSVSHAGQVMPPKATYFYPKLPSGLVINAVD